MLSDVKMILHYVNIVQNSFVNIDDSADNWQIELESLLIGQPTKKPGNEIGKY
jgi:hypothetical protein